jgi:hypothetical protein
MPDVRSGCAARADRVPASGVSRFPLRTIILMILTLAAFVWFYWNTHRAPPPKVREVHEVQVSPIGGDR